MGFRVGGGRWALGLEQGRRPDWNIKQWVAFTALAIAATAAVGLLLHHGGDTRKMVSLTVAAIGFGAATVMGSLSVAKKTHALYKARQLPKIGPRPDARANRL